MKILSIILALFATSFAVHAQTYTKAELTQAAYNIQQGHNEGAKICLTYKAQVEASKAWTEESNTSLAYVEQDDEQHATQYIDEAFNCQQKLSAQFNLSKYMGYYPIQNQRGYVYLTFGMYEKAIECFKDIVDNASPDTLASVYYLAANNLSTCYFIMNQLDKAIPLLETVKKATPTLAYTVSQNLSMDYALTGNAKKALERHHCHDALEGI